MSKPTSDQPVSFERHIKPLFRPTDRQTMTFAFDLWDVSDVRTYAEDILDRLKDGTMPCDGAWSADRVELFSRWVATGRAD